MSNKLYFSYDEIDDTRKTLEYVVNKIKEELEPSQIGIAVVHNKKKQKLCMELVVDAYYCAQEIEDKWVVYPWE